MLVSIMSVLHERLPTSQFVFRHRKMFKDSQIKLGQSKLTPINTKGSPEQEERRLSQVEDMVMSPIKAIASPKVLRGYSPAQRQTVVKSTFGFKPEETDPTRKASEFKIKK